MAPEAAGQPMREQNEVIRDTGEAGPGLFHKKVIPMYGYPGLKYPPRKLPKGTVVEHKDLRGVPLVIEAGPRQGVSGEIYLIRKPDGKVGPVLRKNLIL
jgi:hypothetical protein